MEATKTERFTRQRKVLLDELRGLDTHPTADELYELVRRKIPNISLGTVYRNLENFSRQGVILKIELSGDRKRFDGNTKPHLHFRCEQCERVTDVFTDKMAAIEDIINSIQTEAHRIDSFYVELKGVCKQCAAQ